MRARVEECQALGMKETKSVIPESHVESLILSILPLLVEGSTEWKREFHLRYACHANVISFPCNRQGNACERSLSGL